MKSKKNKPSLNNSYEFKAEVGLNEELVCEISALKNEPLWMLELRLKALQSFVSQPLQSWGPDLSKLSTDDLCFYLKSVKKPFQSWKKVPEDIKQTFEHLGVPQAERAYLAGLGAQFESESVYHNLKEEWQKQGVIFLDTDTGLQKYPKIFKEHFCSVVPLNDNKFAALNTAVWSGGSFIYIPKGVKLEIPLQTYFRIQSEKMGQFERTLIVADEGSQVTYIEGCTAPAYSSTSLHGAVVEIIAKKGARVRYYTIQNWSQNIYNLVTKRAVAYQDAVVEWIDGNFGSGITMKYPAVILKEQGAKAELLSIALATHKDQIQDTGSKIIHMAPDTTSRVVSKSISSNGGQANYRGLIKISDKAINSKSYVQCHALIMDNDSQSDTYPYIDVANDNVDIGHEASVSQISEEQLFYLMSRGIDKNQARTLIVNGFVEPFVKELPMEYAVEMNRLISLEMEDAS